MTLGERIKLHRNKLGFSQEKIAELVGTSRQAVTKWEADISVPCMENLMTLAEVFGVSLTELSQGGTAGENAAQEGAQNEQRKPPLFLDIVFVIVAVFAVLSIIKIPSYIGYSVTGFIAIAVQVAAVLYIPVYLFLIRPARMRQNRKQLGKAGALNRLYWAAGTGTALTACFFLCRYVFYELNGNKDWAFVLFMLGLAVILISAFAGAKKVMISTAAGYVIGFTAGIVFNSDYINEYGALYNNAWQIWTASFLALIIAGMIWEIVDKHITRARKKRAKSY